MKAKFLGIASQVGEKVIAKTLIFQSGLAAPFGRLYGTNARPPSPNQLCDQNVGSGEGERPGIVESFLLAFVLTAGIPLVLLAIGFVAGLIYMVVR